MSKKFVFQGAYREIEERAKELGRDIKDLKKIESEISESQLNNEKIEDYMIAARKTLINDIHNQVKQLYLLSEQIPHFTHLFKESDEK